MLSVKFNHNYYDEYPLNDFILYPDEEAFGADFIEYIQKRNISKDDLFSLANDYEYDSIQEFLNDLILEELYNQHYEVLNDLFPDQDFDFFPF